MTPVTFTMLAPPACVISSFDWLDPTVTTTTMFPTPSDAQPENAFRARTRPPNRRNRRDVLGTGPMNDGDITSEHTCAFMEQVLEDIELIRLEMGRPRDARVPMHVRDASPREVYYHAQTIHRKVSQLCVELGAQ